MSAHCAAKLSRDPITLLSKFIFLRAIPARRLLGFAHFC